MRNSIVLVATLLMLIPRQIVLSQEFCPYEDAMRTFCVHEARWLGVDPLADQYPDVSPYVYCEDNPLMYVDPDGEESVLPIGEDGILINSSAEEDYKRWHYHEKYSDQWNYSTINVFGHGNYEGTLLQISYSEGSASLNDICKDNVTMSVEELSKHMYEQSDLWKDYIDGGEKQFTIVCFRSCNLGKEGGLAQQFSNEYKNVLVVAPTGALVQKDDYTTCIFDSKTEKRGYWVFYFNGELVNSMASTTYPIFNYERNKAKYNKPEQNVDNSTNIEK